MFVENIHDEKGDIKYYLKNTYSYMPDRGYIDYIEGDENLALDAFYAKWIEVEDIERFMPYKMRSEEIVLTREDIEKMPQVCSNR